MSRPTFYKVHASKDDVFQALSERHHREIRRHIHDAVMAAGDGPSAELFAMVDAFMRWRAGLGPVGRVLDLVRSDGPMSTASGPATIVSGAASGIGRHMAIALARADHRLMLTDIDAAGLDALVAEQGWQQNDSVLLRTHDVRDEKGWDTLVEQTVNRFGALDLMLNIAGYLRPSNITDIDTDTVDKHIDINVKGVMYATRSGARQMVQQRYGHIINLASIAAISHVPGLATYCASKHAVRGFSLSVAHELSQRGVHVTVFCPDAVETNARQTSHADEADLERT